MIGHSYIGEGGSGVGWRLAGVGARENTLSLGCAVEFEAGQERGIGKCEDGGGEKRGVDGPCATDGERCDGNACGHLDDA